MNTIYTNFFDAPPFDKGEILRYAGTKESTAEIDSLINDCIDEVKSKLSYKVCYGHFPISFMEIKSEKLTKNLSGCDSFILFAATIGIEIDRLIAKYGKTAPSKALIFQAIGTERIESLCDEFCRFIECEYGYTKPRFSPGYGDLSIEVQKDFFNVLEPSKRIGLSLNESMLMSPSKSVTAIVGISGDKTTTKKSCTTCDKTDCLFRREL